MLWKAPFESASDAKRDKASQSRSRGRRSQTHVSLTKSPAVSEFLPVQPPWKV